MAVVLVINDDDAILDLYETVLTSMGHTPIAKEIMASGPETVRDVGADVLVVDLQRGDQHDHGLRIIEELRADEATRNFPIILCTGAHESARTIGPRLNQLGVPVVLKPFSIEALEQTLTAALDGRFRPVTGASAGPRTRMLPVGRDRPGRRPTPKRAA